MKYINLAFFLIIVFGLTKVQGSVSCAERLEAEVYAGKIYSGVPISFQEWKNSIDHINKVVGSVPIVYIRELTEEDISKARNKFYSEDLDQQSDTLNNMLLVYEKLKSPEDRYILKTLLSLICNQL